MFQSLQTRAPIAILVLALNAMGAWAAAVPGARPASSVPDLAACSGPASGIRETTRVSGSTAPGDESAIPGIIAAMSLAEKAGQLVQTDIAAATPADIRRYGIGSIISTIPDGSLGSAAAWRRIADSYQREALQTRTGIPVVFGIDAVHGHSYFDGNSVILLHNIGLGATRNPQLAQRLAEITARELTATGVRWTFSPNIAVARNIRWGRTYESLGEDPLLQLGFTEAIIAGYQGFDLAGVGRVAATAKHFIADGATDDGVDRGNATLTAEELRSTHLPAFAEAIDSGVAAIMVSFSSINGEKLHGSRAMLTDLLKTELGFDGVVVSDWEGIRMSELSIAEGLNAGIDVFMFAESWKTSLPGIIEAVENGTVPVARLDDAVARILRMKLSLGLFAEPYSSAACEPTLGSQAHRDIARQAVRESLVLLKNDDGILPLDKDSKVIVVGSHADNPAYQSGGWTKKWQGAHADLYGHAAREVAGATSIIDGIRAVIGSDRVIDAGISGISDDADIAIVVVGETPYSEGVGDREAEELVLSAEQSALIEAYHRAGIKVVTVLVSGRPLLVNEELRMSAAFVAAWLPGSEAQGIAEVLFGDYNFTGKLGFSWPRDAGQIPVNVGDPDYDPLFPFGFGLNYPF